MSGFQILFFILLFFYSASLSVSLVTVTPSNALAVAGDSITVACETLQSAGAWTVHYHHGDTCVLSSGADLRSCADSARISLSFTRTQSRVQNMYGQYQIQEHIRLAMTIRQVRMSDAGTYICSLGSEDDQTSLTVLESAPSGVMNPTHVMAGDELSLTCRVTYHGSFTPRATWTNSAGRNVSNGVKSRVAGSTDGTLMNLESTLTVPVAVDTVRVEPYTCTVGLSVPTQSSTSPTWRSSAIEVSYCPHELAIKSTDDGITVGTELTCVSRAHPAAAYRWLALTGSGFVSEADNRTLTVTSKSDDGNYHFMCIAYNYLSGSGRNPCFASVEIQEFLPGSQDETAFPAESDKQLDGTAATSTMASSPPESSDEQQRHERTARSQNSAVLSSTAPILSSSATTITSRKTTDPVLEGRTETKTGSTLPLTSTTVAAATFPIVSTHKLPPSTTSRIFSSSTLSTTSLTSTSTTIKSTTYTSSRAPTLSTSIKSTVLYAETSPSGTLVTRSKATDTSDPRPIEASYTSSEIQQQKLSQYQTATVVLSVLMCLVIFTVVVIGFAVIRLMRREPHRNPFYQPVEWHNSAKSVSPTEMSSLTVADAEHNTTL